MCTNCIMDTTDPEISFNSDGMCNHCTQFLECSKTQWFPNEAGKNHLNAIVEKIKKEGKGKEYDSILGLSGGVDSSYLALKVKEMGLRPLVVHVDAGWNTELAVKNIELVVKYCGFDLHTHVVNWEDMQDLHLAYLKSGISNQDVPQDHVFFASLYHFAIKNKIKTIFSGGNFATEGIFPLSWHGGSAMDAINLLDIHRRFGSRKLQNYKTISFFQYYFLYPFILKMRTVRPLNFMPYNKESAIIELETKMGWKSYGRKHGESHFTKLFQNYILPEKFGYDKRLPHLSSLIISGQLSKSNALRKLKEPLYDANELEEDIEYFCKKINITREVFFNFVKAENRSYSDYKNWDGYYLFLKKVQSKTEKILGKKISVYS